MEIPRESYADAKKKAKAFYKSIGRVWCPAVNEYVIFDSAGFRHLIQKTAIPRSRAEQLRRFALLPHVITILKKPDVIPRHFVKDAHEPPIHLWVFIEVKEGVRVTIVIRQSGNGKYHFFSIYGKKQKSTQ
jgi:hypothetical protein